MKLKFSTIEEIKKFNYWATRFDGDVSLKSGRYIIDAKSIDGIFTLSLDKPVDLEITSKNEQEVNDFINQLRELGIYRD